MVIMKEVIMVISINLFICSSAFLAFSIWNLRQSKIYFEMGKKESAKVKKFNDDAVEILAKSKENVDKAEHLRRESLDFLKRVENSLNETDERVKIIEKAIKIRQEQQGVS